MTELDLTDPRIREMADRNHQPRECWTAAGELFTVHCRCCGHRWPCETRTALDTQDRPRKVRTI